MGVAPYSQWGKHTLEQRAGGRGLSSVRTLVSGGAQKLLVLSLLAAALVVACSNAPRFQEYATNRYARERRAVLSRCQGRVESIGGKAGEGGGRTQSAGPRRPAAIQRLHGSRQQYRRDASAGGFGPGVDRGWAAPRRSGGPGKRSAAKVVWMLVVNENAPLATTLHRRTSGPFPKGIGAPIIRFEYLAGQWASVRPGWSAIA